VGFESGQRIGSILAERGIFSAELALGCFFFGLGRKYLPPLLGESNNSIMR